MSLLKPFYKSTCFFGGFSVLILIDQLLKYKIRHDGGFYLCNTGISFGVQVPDIVFWLILGIFFFILLLFLYKNSPPSCIFTLGLTLFAGGALSNIIDRLIFGCVLDYISVFQKVFPVFNIADIGILIGVCLVFIEPFLKNTQKR